MKIKNYFRGLLIILLVLILGVLGLLFLGLITASVNVVYGLLAIVIFIIALLILPSYLGKKKVIRSKSYLLKKVKKSK